MAKQKLQKNVYRGFVGYIILPLILINSYAFWKLYEASGHWSLSIVPISLSDTLTHLAIILGINNIVILSLIIYVKFFKK